jgi:hypothetical protein
MYRKYASFLSKNGHGLRTELEEFGGLADCELGYEYHSRTSHSRFTLIGLSGNNQFRRHEGIR